MHAPFEYDYKYRNNSSVTIGSTVILRDLDTSEIESYTLVRPDEVDILRNRISSFSPLGLALGGRHVGEIVEVDAPGGWVHLEIEQIVPDRDFISADESCEFADA